MNFSAGHKSILFLVITITAAVFFALPLLFTGNKTLYIYADTRQINSEKQSFIQELRQLGFHVKINSKKETSENSDVLWFSSENIYEKLSQSKFRFNFVYMEEFYPLDWQRLTKPVIVLTPHQELFEHYMRSNVPSAKMQLSDITKENTKEAALRFYEIWKWVKENSEPNSAD